MKRAALKVAVLGALIFSGAVAAGQAALASDDPRSYEITIPKRDPGAADRSIAVRHPRFELLDVRDRRCGFYRAGDHGRNGGSGRLGWRGERRDWRIPVVEITITRVNDDDDD